MTARSLPPSRAWSTVRLAQICANLRSPLARAEEHAYGQGRSQESTRPRRIAVDGYASEVYLERVG
jgi:hypothetical protein